MPSRITEWRAPLRAWQSDAFAQWSATQDRDALIVATPGAGKTRFAARLAHALLYAGSVQRVIVVVPREHLKAQVALTMAEHGMQMDYRFSNAVKRLAPDMHGAVVSYQQVAFAPQVFRALTRVPTLVVLDEIHHAGDSATWGQALKEAFEVAEFRIAMSGTPFRSDGTPIPFVRYIEGASVPAYAYDYTSALRDGVCRPLVFPLQGGVAEWVSHDGKIVSASFETALETKRLESERLRTALTQESWIGDVVQKAHAKVVELRAHGHADAAGLAIAMNQQHARFIADVLHARTGVTPAIVVSEDDDASRRIKLFARSRDPWIVAVHMVSEGVDIPRLRVGVYGSNVNTEMYFRQFCGRFVRAGDPRVQQQAFVYLPDDPKLRNLAARITADVRSYLKKKREDDGLAAATAVQTEATAVDGQYAGIAATAIEGRTLDYGPLFNPGYADSPAPAPASAAPAARGNAFLLHEPPKTLVDEKEALRRTLAVLVARVSERFNVEHRYVHATLNQRFGGPISEASLESLTARRRIAEAWLARNAYDGLNSPTSR
jgi:superfamily II DNA or RNA helicase